MKHPSLQFYPGDWLRDDVSGCSLSAQGLWLRLLFVMHDSPRRGFLTSGQAPMPDENAARKCGTDLATFRALLKELEDAGVTSRTPDGTLYNRRMVRDEHDRTRERERKRRQRPPKQGCPTHFPADVPPVVPPLSHRSSSSSSSSTSTSDKDPPNPPAGGSEFQAAVADWLAYKAERGQRYKPRGLKALYSQLAEWGESKSINAIRQSIRSNYAGLFEPTTNAAPPRPEFVFKPPEPRR